MAKLLMMVGISGSGKSTIAQALSQGGATIVSSDAIREELWGDANNQQSPGVVFDAMNRKTKELLKNGEDVIYDATNLNLKRRQSLLHQLRSAISNLTTECHLVVAEPQRCIDNQLLRERQVPEYAVKRQLASFQMPDMTEGWTEPIVIHNPFYRDNLLAEFVQAMKGVSQTGPWHQETVDTHNLLVANHAQHMGYDNIVQEMALYHDIGKPFTRHVDDNGNTHFFGHANTGAYMYLAAMAPDGPLSHDIWHRAMIIQHHMDLVIQPDREKIRAQVGDEIYRELLQLHEADSYGAIRAVHKDMHILDFLNTFHDWEIRLNAIPFCCQVKRDGEYVLLQYQQLNSDFSSRIVQECRGSIFHQNDKGEWAYVCRPFDKFFNHGQVEASEIDWNTACVVEKIDGCFSSQDRVTLANGTRMAFDSILHHMQMGETLSVLSYNIHTHMIEAKRILRVKRSVCEYPQSEWLTIFYQPSDEMQSHMMTVTRNHVLFARNADESLREVCAADISIGDRFLYLNPQMQLCDGIVSEISADFRRDGDKTWKFDIEVEDNHNYFCQGVLVHNSLMKMWYHNQEWHLSTNGTIDAFKAPVADWHYSYGDIFNRALGMPYHKLAAWLDSKYTYLFELTSPDTQLVVPYSDGVWYLARRQTIDGEEKFDRPNLPGVKLPKVFDMKNLDDVLSVVQAMPREEEGVVVRDANSNRIKIKSPEYLIASHLLNNKMVSVRNLIIYMQEGKIDDFLAYCPQYTDRVNTIRERIGQVCNAMESEWERYSPYVSLPRKEFAEMVCQSPHKSYVFVKANQPDITAEQYLMRQTTPACMRILGLTNDEPKCFENFSMKEDAR